MAGSIIQHRKRVINNSDQNNTLSIDETLLDEFKELWAAADTIWNDNDRHPGFHAYVSADYSAVVKSLAQFRDQNLRFIEWGSGLGVVTIMASRMGFEAYGIEAESALLDHAEELAEKFGPDATFAQGSFIPNGFQFDPGSGDESIRTIIDVPDAYDDLGMEICDFDLIYSYPWPTEHHLYHNVLREYGHTGSILVTYDARESIDIVKTSDL